MINVIERLKEDIRTIFSRDPAARTTLEVAMFYPGFHALQIHRLTHWLWGKRFKLLARGISQFARFVTGIEIHPGATIGRRFFIDHGMGVVIGETSEIGDDVTLYHGVTLGGVSLEKVKRHPTIHDRVVVGTGAKILGPVVIGADSKIGAGSVVVRDVPPYSTVVGIPGRVVFRTPAEARSNTELDHGELPDPESRAIQCLMDQVHQLDHKIKELREDLKKHEEEKENDSRPNAGDSVTKLLP